jgi:hypothetical protein
MVSDEIMSLGLVSLDGNIIVVSDSILPCAEDTISQITEIAQSNDSSANVDSPATISVHPLCLPLMYIPSSFRHLGDTTPENLYTSFAICAKALKYITAHHADLYVSISDPTRLKQIEIGKTKIHETFIDDNEDEKLYIKRSADGKRSYWTRSAYMSLQITQNFATDNWYQGSVNAFTMLGNIKAYANYKKESFSWENLLEWRVGVSTISGDTVHKLNTTDDRFQVYSKFGFQVHKKWYVSMFADFKTNLFPNYKKNSHQLNATFLTPLRYSMGVGVDCKIIKGLSFNLSPVTYKMVYAYVGDPSKINIADFGILSNNLVQEVGSSLRMEWKWKPIREILLDAKFYFFTNYKQIETELEINVDFIINRYMSAKLMLHPRYDGTVDEATEQRSKLQFKEVISIGFAHTFR